MKFTIDRSKWIRGKDRGMSYLLRPADGKRCCVGFYLQACGLTDEQLSNRCYADSYDQNLRKDDLPAGTEWLHISRSKEGGDSVYYVNDDMELTETEREERIAARFAREGHEVEFVDSAPSGEGQ